MVVEFVGDGVDGGVDGGVFGGVVCSIVVGVLFFSFVCRVVVIRALIR